MDDNGNNCGTLFETLPQGAFYQSADGTLTDVNPTALSLLGIAREDLLARPMAVTQWQVILEDGTALAPEQHPSMIALRTGEPVRNFIAGVFNQKMQGFIWLNFDAIPQFRPGEAGPYRAFVTMYDISEHKRISDIHLSRFRLMQVADSYSIERLLVEVLDELERLTGSTIGFYHFYDEASKRVTLKAWSTRTENSFCNVPEKKGHYSIEQAGVWIDCIRMGKAIIHNDYEALPNRRGLPPGHAPIVRELVVPVKRNGVTVAVLGVGNKPVEYSDADLITVFLFADLTWDIAERKKMQDALLGTQHELKQANEFLEQRVVQRTAELQTAIREQEAFSYSVSHDLRAPLRHINSYSAILMEDFADDLPDAARDYLLRMQAASNRMGTLIDHLLELSRMARADISLTKVSLSGLAESFLCMLQETDPHRRVEQRVEPGITAAGDQHLLHQLMGNLLENAWKYTSQKPTAVIEFGKAVVSGQEAYFVRDNGAGFDMTHSEKLFKPFERLHGSEFEGVGIGLATSQRIIERHGGTIWAEGRAGDGATFYFTLSPAESPA